MYFCFPRRENIYFTFSFFFLIFFLFHITSGYKDMQKTVLRTPTAYVSSPLRPEIGFKNHLSKCCVIDPNRI